jgi:hypothetical protein
VQYCGGFPGHEQKACTRGFLFKSFQNGTAGCSVTKIELEFAQGKAGFHSDISEFGGSGVSDDTVERSD